MSVWSVAVASLGWLAISARVTTGSLHMLVVWALGMVVAYAGFEIAQQVKRSRGGANAPSTSEGGPRSPSGRVSPTPPLDASSPAGVGGKSGANLPDGREGESATYQSSSSAEQLPAATAAHCKLPAVLTAEEAAGFLRVPLDDLLAALRDGTAPGNQVANNWRCSAPALLSWLEGGWAAGNAQPRLPPA